VETNSTQNALKTASKRRKTYPYRGKKKKNKEGKRGRRNFPTARGPSTLIQLVTISRVERVGSMHHTKSGEQKKGGNMNWKEKGSVGRKGEHARNLEAEAS